MSARAGQQRHSAQGERGDHAGQVVFAVRMSAIGDTLMTVRALARIRARGVEPVLVTSKGNADVARCVPFLKWFAIAEGGTIALHERSGSDPVGRPLTIEEWPRFERAHLLDLHRTSRSRKALAALRPALAAAGIPTGRTAGVSKRTALRVWLVFWAWLVSKLAHQAPRRRDWRVGMKRVHELQAAAVDSLLARAGLPPGPAAGAAAGTAAGVAGPDSAEATTPLFSALPVTSGQPMPIPLPRPGDYVVFVPGASGFVKQWPKEHFRRLAQALRARGVRHVVVVGGPQEEPLGAYICHGGGEGFFTDATGALTLAQTFRVIEQARYVYTGDTFAAHVADLTGTPGAVFFGATSPLFGFAPVSPSIEILYADLACSPCTRHGLLGCRFANVRCQRLLSPESAAEHFR